jgi:hypothetical protein
MNGTAATALEMMMMGLSGNLVTRGIAGHLNRGEPFILDQVGDVSINSCNTQRVRSPLSKGEGLVRGERAIRFKEGCANGFLLSRFSNLDLFGHPDTPCTNNNILSLAGRSLHVSALQLQAATGLLAIFVLLVVMNWFFHKQSARHGQLGPESAVRYHS